ncbi:DUF6882 domain-containing protein [Methanobrevibacter sp.]|uniref:DUF6882 domain-containing protein n=1 Tax=Methanobrevibacter sp. TaxID=66852 RepID=UPI002E773975|nr:DUF6882 domain-containing protein [Methanobrevibacter sp.]MEE1337098.1 hypothetical protein [Methanobrevibacter sp.]
MKTVEKPVTIEEGDSFKVLLSKYGALALDKQENLSELIDDKVGDLDIEKGELRFDDIIFPVQILGFFMQDSKQWSWAWDNEDIFGEKLIKSALQIKAIGEEFEIPEFTTPLLNATYDDCHTLAMTTSSILAMDAYYAVSEDGLDIFVCIKSDLIKENDSAKKFRDTFYTFQKNFNIYPKIAFESYTKLKGYGFKPHDDFALAKIGEARVMAGYTERGNITRLLIFGDDER